VAASVEKPIEGSREPGPEKGPEERRRIDPAGPVSFAGYEILGEIHRGGQGTVYRALQKATHRVVALKILHHRRGCRKIQKERFQREVDLTATLRHPNIVTIYDSGTYDGTSYYAMEHIEGETLDTYLEENSLDLEQRAYLFFRIAQAVGYAHEHGVVHRDLKPGNILVGAGGEPHILDFGLAKGRDSELESIRRKLTSPGEFLGTLAYAAPEQTRVHDDHTDARTDVYALGVVFYEGLCGRRPYPYGDNMVQAVRHIAETEPTVLERTGQRIDRDLNTIVQKALAKEPARRYDTAAELASDLQRWLEGLPIRARHDSRSYVVWKVVKRAIARRPAIALLLVALVSLFAGKLAPTSLEPAAELNLRFAPLVKSIGGLHPTSRWSDEVVVIGIDDATTRSVPELTHRLEIEDVDPYDFVSWRRLHGALLERLSLAGASVVAVDIWFASEQPMHDPHLVRGIRELRDAGTRVILAADRIHDDGTPALSPAVLDAADGWGSMRLATKGTRVVGSGLAIAHPDLPDVPSLALAAYLAHRHADRDPRIEWRNPANFVDVRLSAPGGDDDGPRRPSTVERQFLYDVFREVDAWAGPDRAFLWFDVSVPPAEALAERTVPYHEVFDRTPEELREMFGGRLVVLIDRREHPLRGEPDRCLVAGEGGERPEFHGYVHGKAMSDLLQGSRSRRLDFVSSMILLGALASIQAALCYRYHRKSAVLWIAGAQILLAGGLGVILAATSGVLLPLSGILVTILLASLGAVAVRWIENRSRPWLVLDARSSSDAVSPALRLATPERYTP